MCLRIPLHHTLLSVGLSVVEVVWFWQHWWRNQNCAIFCLNSLEFLGIHSKSQKDHTHRHKKYRQPLGGYFSFSWDLLILRKKSRSEHLFLVCIPKSTDYYIKMYNYITLCKPFKTAFPPLLRGVCILFFFIEVYWSRQPWYCVKFYTFPKYEDNIYPSLNKDWGLRWNKLLWGQESSHFSLLYNIY